MRELGIGLTAYGVLSRGLISGALDVELTPSDVERIERTVPPGAAAGTRYNAYLMGDVDSENASSTVRRKP